MDGGSDSFYKVPSFPEIMESARNFSRAHQILATLMLNKGVLTKRRFYISFLRNVVVVDLKRHVGVVSKIICSVEDLNGLVTLLYDQLNERLSVLGLRLTTISEEESGNELVVLVSEDILARDIGYVSGFTVDEMNLFSVYLREFVGGNGKCDIYWALHQASKLPNSMTLMKAQQFIDKLVCNGWILKSGKNIMLEPRAIAELEPLLVNEHGCRRCFLCQKVVVRKNLAMICDSCDVYIHRHCWLKFAASSGADEICCPARTWRKCEKVFSKCEVAKAFS